MPSNSSAPEVYQKNFFEFFLVVFEWHVQRSRGQPPAAKFGTQKLQNSHFWEQFGRVLISFKISQKHLVLEI